MPSGIKSLFGGSDSGSRAAGISNEFFQQGIDELRRQFDLTQENVQPFVGAGAGALPGLIDAATIEGLDRNLGAVFDSDIFGQLVDERERAVRGQLGAAGLTRSGTALQEIAAVPTGIGLNIENLLNARLSSLAGSGQNAAVGLGSLGQQNAAGIANLLAQQGQNAASGILTDAQSRAQGAQNLLNAATTAAGIFFSDPALKQDAEPIAEIGPLTLWQWDWIPEVRHMSFAKRGSMGFMADEVAEHFPEFVHERSGFQAIDYPGLLDRLGAA